jgi:hypothetical protein
MMGLRSRVKAILPGAAVQAMTNARMRLRHLPWDGWVCTGLGRSPLPISWALRLAEALGPLGVRFSPERVTGGQIFGRGLGLRGEALATAVHERLRLYYRDVVILNRLVDGRGVGDGWAVVDHGIEPVEVLREKGRSILAVSGHFPQGAFALSFRVRQWPGWMVVYSWGTQRAFRTRLAGEFSATALTVRPGAPGFMDGQARVQRGTVQGIRPLTAHLRRAGTAVALMVDLNAPEGAPERPFASRNRFPYFRTAARIARLSGCAIVPFVPYWGKDREVHFDWGTPVEPASDRGGDDAVMNAVFDQLEIKMGRHYAQYFGFAGGKRQWVAERERWELPSGL